MQSDIMSSMYILLLVLKIKVVISENYKNVMLDQGPVRGFKIDDENVFSFYGIPYATAPSGEDRYKDALPPPTWAEVFNATNRDIACPQYKDEHGTRKLDCLVANIFTPANINETNLPVMFYIHGGEFQYGAGDQMLPTNGLVQHGIVFINFNYRLAVHGLLCLNTEFAPGNAGAKDQVVALKWVRHNIGKFGGNPNNITIAGSSAGAAFVDLHIVSPMSSGLFTKAVLEGGNGIATDTITYDPIANADQFANQFRVYPNRNIDILEHFYRALTDEQLNRKAFGYFKPCIETHNITGVEKFLSESPIETFKKGNHNKVTCLAGFTPYEAAVFADFFPVNAYIYQDYFIDRFPPNVPYQTGKDREVKAAKVKNVYFPTGKVTLEGYLDYNSDVSFSYGSYALSRLQSRYMKSYVYLFTYNGTVNLNNTRELLERHKLSWRPVHIAYSLYIHLYYIRSIYENMTAEDYVMKDKLQLIYYNFCKYGDPTIKEDHLLDNVRWLPITPEKPYYLEIDEKFAMKEFPLQERFSFLDEVYEINYLTRPGTIDTSDESSSSSNKLKILPLSVIMSITLTAQI